jgi:phosphoribosyl 1,2-cyclic phosphodiesterase
MRLWVLGSGSKGNALLLECGETRVLVDAGFSARRLAARLGEINVDPSSIGALVLTHEHSDHITGAVSAAKRWSWEVYGTAGTLSALPTLAPERTTTFAAGDTLSVGTIALQTVATSHDAAEPVAYIATSTCSGMRAGIVTDLGIVTESVREAVRLCDVLVLESNHDETMLRTGPYPYHLKRRIAGPHGHLSNAAAAQVAIDAAHRGLCHLVLAHLSETNNTPETALDTMRVAIKKSRWRGTLTAAPQHTVIGPFGDAASVGGQLSLSL